MKPTKPQPETYVLTLKAKPDILPATVRLRRALKRLLRGYGLECTSVVPAKSEQRSDSPDTPPQGTSSESPAQGFPPPASLPRTHRRCDMPILIEPEHKSLLANVLAHVDATFLPLRAYGGASPILPNEARVAIFERQSAYQRRGVPWLIGGDTGTRQAGRRLLLDAAGLGLIVICSHGGGRRQGVRLTELGDLAARYFTLGYMLAEAWPVVRTLAQLTTGHQCILEDDLATAASLKGDSVELRRSDVENRLLATLALGLVRSAVDIEGRAYYSLSSHGRNLAKRNTPPAVARSRDIPERKKTDKAFADAYDAEFAGMLEQRLNWKPLSTSAVYVPLPDGGGPNCVIPRPRKR